MICSNHRRGEPSTYSMQWYYKVTSIPNPLADNVKPMYSLCINIKGKSFLWLYMYQFDLKQQLDNNKHYIVIDLFKQISIHIADTFSVDSCVIRCFSVLLCAQQTCIKRRRLINLNLFLETTDTAVEHDAFDYHSVTTNHTSYAQMYARLKFYL